MEYRLQSLLPALALSSLAALPIFSVSAQPASNAQVDEIDRSFVCPENLPNEEARQNAVKQFLEKMNDLKPSPTIGQVMDFRVALLKKHNCTKTLENIESGTKSADDNPNIADQSSKDRWVDIIKTTDANPLTVSIDADRFVAGPSFLRIWIRYRTEQPDKRNVKNQFVHEKLDCAQKSHLAVSLYAYDTSGHVLYGGSDESGAQEPVTSDSLLAGILTVACSFQQGQH